MQVVNTLDVADGGPARNAVELASSLNKLEGVEGQLFWLHGHYNDSILAADDASLEKGFADGMRRVRFLPNQHNRSTTIVDFVRHLRRADIVIVHGYFLPWIPLVAAGLVFLRTPYVITPHGSLTRRQQGISIRKKRIYEAVFGRFVRKHLSTFVTGSPIEITELKEAFPNSNAIVGGVGTRLPERFKSGDDIPETVRLLSMSRIAEKKRIDISIRAVSILMQRGYKVSLSIAGVGSDELTRRLHKLVSELSLDDSVTFLGQVKGQEKNDLFCSSDIFLLPSEDENFGIGFAEAMSHGLPSVVSSNVAAANHMPAEAGELLIAPTPETVADAVVAMLDPERHKKGQVVARDFASKEFSWSAVASVWADIANAHAR